MSNAIVAAVVAGVGVVLGVVVVQSVLDGASTATWSAGTLALTFLIPLVLAAVGIMGILKLTGKM